MIIYIVGKIFDGEQVLDPETSWAIRIKDGHIAAIVRQAELEIKPGEKVIDFSHLSALPGLIDAHTHLVHDGKASEDWKLLGLSESVSLGTLRALRNSQKHL